MPESQEQGLQVPRCPKESNIQDLSSLEDIVLETFLPTEAKSTRGGGNINWLKTLSFI